MHVIKRDGTRVLFNPDKIVRAINKAMVSTYGSVYESDTAEEIADLIGQRGVDMTVEQIQDLVEEYLMKSEYPEVAKSYIIYRDQRNKRRKSAVAGHKRICEDLYKKNEISEEFYTDIKDIEIPAHAFVLFPTCPNDGFASEGVLDCVPCHTFICSFSLKEDSLDMWI